MKRNCKSLFAFTFILVLGSLSACVTPRKSSSGPVTPPAGNDERPCASLTVESANTARQVRAKYPNVNSNPREACAYYREYRSYLANSVLPRSRQCDPSGRYSNAVIQRIGEHDSAANSVCR
jgi:hypothetical protein